MAGLPSLCSIFESNTKYKCVYNSHARNERTRKKLINAVLVHTNTNTGARKARNDARWAYCNYDWQQQAAIRQAKIRTRTRFSRTQAKKWINAISSARGRAVGGKVMFVRSPLLLLFCSCKRVCDRSSETEKYQLKKIYNLHRAYKLNTFNLYWILYVVCCPKLINNYVYKAISYSTSIPKYTAILHDASKNKRKRQMLQKLAEFSNTVHRNSWSCHRLITQVAQQVLS